MEKVKVEPEKYQGKSPIQTREQALADEIWKHFDRQVAFGRLVKTIKDKGWQCIYEIFQEVKVVTHPAPQALFWWKVGRVKIEWKK